ncbi:MAG: hypothetical protein PHS98_05180 [Bacilli bacterium]|nr:hypothetical protein [Bacilli bacterium]
MLLSTETIVKWHYKNKDYYEQKGYIFTKFGDEFIVRVDDLTKSSSAMIKCLCDYCLDKNKTTIIDKKYFIYKQQNELSIIHKDCCSNKECLIEKRKESNLEQYNVESTNQLDKMKIKKGTDSFIKNKNKKIQRYRNNYGIILDKDLLVNTYNEIQWWEWVYYGLPDNNKFIKQIPLEIQNDKNKLINIMRYVIENVIKCDTRDDILRLTLKILEEYKIHFKHTFTSSIYLLLKEIYPEYNFQSSEFNNNIAYDNTLLNSKEELLIYEFIKKYLKLPIKAIGLKKKYKYYNAKCNEYYCPDFIIEMNNKKTIVEYFGLFRETDINHIMGKGYHDKTLRKIEFYKSINNIDFIDLYPEDLKNNLQGVRDKLNNLLQFQVVI